MGFMFLTMLFPVFLVAVVAWLIHSAIQSKRLPEGTAQDLKRLQDQVEELATRLHRIEDEREFDRQLLEGLADRQLPSGEEAGRGVVSPGASNRDPDVDA